MYTVVRGQAHPAKSSALATQILVVNDTTAGKNVAGHGLHPSDAVICPLPAVVYESLHMQGGMPTLCQDSLRIED